MDEPVFSEGSLDSYSLSERTTEENLTIRLDLLPLPAGLDFLDGLDLEGFEDDDNVFAVFALALDDIAEEVVAGRVLAGTEGDLTGTVGVLGDAEDVAIAVDDGKGADFDVSIVGCSDADLATNVSVDSAEEDSEGAALLHKMTGDCMAGDRIDSPVADVPDSSFTGWR